MKNIRSPEPPIEPRSAMEEERKIMKAYIDTAKTYSQLSLGALVLSVTFLEKFVSSGNLMKTVDTWLVVSWIGWLLSAVSGAIYQYLAVRFLEARGEDWGLLARGNHPQMFQWLAHHPWPAYALMLISFAIASLAFVMVGFHHLRL